MTAPCSLRILFNHSLKKNQPVICQWNLKAWLFQESKARFDAGPSPHRTLLTQHILPHYFLVVHWFYSSCLACETHVQYFFFCSVQGFLWAAAVPEVTSSFLVARKQISPSIFSHLTVVFSLHHPEVPSLINGKRKVEWATTETEVIIIMVEDDSLRE